MPRSMSYQEELIESLKDPEEAALYIEACLEEGDPEVLRLALGDVVEAHRRMHTLSEKGFFYDFSNYGSYERLTDDGLTQWHPAFLQLGSTLEECAQKYRGFCQKYKPKGKTPTRSHWGSRLLAGVHLNPSPDKKRSKKANHTQKVAGHTGCQVWSNELVAQVVRQFIKANRAPKEAGKDF